MQLNIQVPWQDMVSHTNPFDKDSRWTNIPPIRFIVTDIECAGRPAIFPTPSEDSVIMQSIVMGTVGGKQGVLKKAIVSWGKVDFESDKGIPDDSPDKRHAYCVQYEHQLFTTVTDLINAADPDLIFTYNGTGFDFPYICNRLKHLIENKLPQNLEELMSIEPIQHNPEQEKERLLNIKRLQYEIPKLAEAYCMGRKYDSKVSLKSWKPQQRAKMGRNSEELLGLTGRVHLDVLTAIVRAEKLRSYTLNAVAMKFLGKSKYDVHHSQITKLWRSGVKGRTRVAEYCIQDSILPFELVISNKLQLLFRNAMIAKITQLPFYDILYKGQTAKVLMMIRRWLIKFNMVNQTRFKDPNKTTEPQGYEGAIVIPPKPAFFGTKKIKLPDGTIKEEKNPVITNDFNSLYPTIVIDFNLCYSTHLSDAQAKQAKWVNKFHSTYEGAHFLDTEVRKGLLPDLLEYLLDARLQLKSMMKAEPNPDKKSVLDGIQLGAKLVANSLYGFTGFEGLNMPDLGIASGVTSYGRANIELTTDFVENYVNNLLAKEGELNPNDPDDRVIVRYGDTDSFMATIPKKYRESIKLAMEFGRRSAKMCTDFLRNIDKYAQYVSPQYQDKLANLITVRRTKVNLEFEKVFCPWIVWKKKRYAGAKYMSNPDTPDDIHVSG
jgi:DNA polymerase delta subunit 1